MNGVISRGARKAFPYILTSFVVLMIFSAYSNTFTSPPYLDDFHSFIYEKSMYLGSVSFSSILALAHGTFGWTRFLPVVTFALNHAWGQSNLIYFHTVNILIHILVFFAFFWLVRQIPAAERNKVHERVAFDLAGFFPLCVAALWALNPVQTNAVTYLVQRMASVQALFFALSVGCFIKARLLTGTKTAALFYGLCVVAAFCSFLSKENSAMLPIMLACTDIWFFDSAWLKKGWAICRKTSWKVRLLFAAAAVSSSFYVFAVILPKILSGYAQRDFTLVERLLTQGRIVVWYMSLLLWPDPSRLSVEHDFAISTTLLSPISTIPALLLIAGLIFLAVRFRKEFPVITYGIVWFFINLAIESTFVPLEMVFEHRLYLPSMGFVLSISALLTMLCRKATSGLTERDFAKSACSIFLVVASCMALLTFQRNEDWENKLTIQYDATVKAPNNPRSHSGLANALCEVGRYEEAIDSAEKSLKLGHRGRETSALAHNALTIALIKLGRTDEAISSAEEFLPDIPKHPIDGDPLPGFCLNVALAYEMKEEPRDAYRWTLEALKYIQMTDNSPQKKELVQAEALRLLQQFGPQGVDLNGDGLPDPGDTSPPVWVAMEFEKHGEPAFAKQILEREYAKAPGDSKLAGIMRDLEKQDALDRAQKEKWNFEDKYVQHPFSKFNFYMTIAFLVQEKHLSGAFEQIGEKCLDAALEISPTSTDAWLLKGWCLYNRDDAAGAVTAARKSLEADPQSAKAWLGLGFFLARAGSAGEAAAAFEKVIEIYPGYSKRAMLEGFSAQLRKGESIESASENRNESSVKAGSSKIPSS